MLVGAPFALKESTTLQAGAGYVYENVNGQFQMLGSPLAGSADFATDEFFGDSVGLSSNQRAVVGASGNSGGGLSGRGAVYIFEFTSTNWTRLLEFQGFSASDGLGGAVDIDESGLIAVAGAAGSANGYALVFEKVGDTWNNTFTIQGDEASQRAVRQ
jgi:hypothetical protein